MSMNIAKNSKIYVSGHRGLVGSAVVRRLEADGFSSILTATRAELDLRDQVAVNQFFDAQRPEFVIHVAGTVGGIEANATRPAEFIYDNLLIHATVLHAAWEFGCEKLLYLGSSCIYPRDCPQPIKEEYILTGPLEVTNEAYAIAKIAGVKSTQAYRRQYGCNFISAMPTNLYGPGDHFDLKNSHVLPALIRKFHEAKIAKEEQVIVWGSGSPRREFLHVDDLADATVYVLVHYDDEMPINIGCGDDLSIAELADLVRQVVYPEVEIVYDRSKPDGTPRKLLDVTRLNDLGWQSKIQLPQGIKQTYDWYLKQNESAISNS